MPCERCEALERELERWRHNQPVEGDYVCPNALRADMAEAEVVALRARLSQSACDHLAPVL